MKLHVILCSHNGERFIEQQLRSILDQSQPVDFIHVFDFGSTDSTVSIVKALAQRAESAPIEIVAYQDTPGASLSFFRAFDELSGRLGRNDFVLLSDQDDVWLPNKVEHVKGKLQGLLRHSANGCILLFHDVAVADEDLGVVRPTYYTGNPFDLPRDLAPDRLLLTNPAIGHTMALSAALILLVAKHATRGGYLMHDWAAVLIASRFGEVHFIREALSLYRQHESNILGAYRKRSIGARLHRVRSFASGLGQQTITFVGDCRKIAAEGHPRTAVTHVDRWLLALHPKRRIRLMLAGLALVRGPTLPRKALSLFIIVDLFKARRSRRQ